MQVEVVAFPDLVKKMVEATVSPKMIRLLAALKSKENATWPETQEARDIQDLVEDQTEALQQELVAFEKVLGVSRYQGRVLLFQREQTKGDKGLWQLSRIEYAGSVAMPNSLGHMRNLCDSLLDNEDEDTTRIAMWVHPLPSPPGFSTMTLVYLRHHRGWDTVFMYKGGAMTRMPLNGDQIGDAFEMLNPVGEPADSAYWKRCLHSLISMADEELRPVLTQALKDKANLHLDDRLWKEICGTLYFQKPFLYFLMEVGRSIASRPMQEGQVLLTSLVEGLTRATKLYEERLSQAQRDHKRELKRRIADHDKLQTAYKGLMERANRQAKDLAMKSSAATAPSADTKNGVTLERSLTELF